MVDGETVSRQQLWIAPTAMQRLPATKPATNRVATVSRSALILRKAEYAVTRGESWLGRRALLDTVRRIPDGYRERHIERHREVIRGRAWPNETRLSSLPQFLDEYEQAALAYIQVGFQAFDFLATGNPIQLESIYRLVEAAEALRGQFGKRSPTGIDARLDNYESQLFGLLEDRLGDYAPTAIELLGTPVEPHITAETALIEDFSLLKSQYPKAPKTDALMDSNKLGVERLWSFIRRHTCWSISGAQRLYETFSGHDFQRQLGLCRTVRREISKARTELILKLESSYPRDWFVKVVDLATGLTLLNHLNLALEPCFSFKGGIGLGQGYIFELASEHGLLPTKDSRLLNVRKWRLFESGNQVMSRLAIA